MTKSETRKRFTRIEQLLGKQALDKLTKSYAVVIGLGATGSYAVEGLARAGVGRLKLVDFDVVELSNINRQLYALESTLGTPKAQVAARRVLDINPACQVEPVEEFFHQEDFLNICHERPNIIIDAIDSLNPKVELLACAVTENIPVVSCMGAALRMDPSKIHIASLDHVRNCRLAKQIRKRLRNRKISLKFPCVYSNEDISKLPEEAIGEYDENPARGRKRRTLGSMPTITGIVGLTAAHKAIQVLIEK